MTVFAVNDDHALDDHDVDSEGSLQRSTSRDIVLLYYQPGIEWEERGKWRYTNAYTWSFPSTNLFFLSVSGDLATV